MHIRNFIFFIPVILTCKQGSFEYPRYHSSLITMTNLVHKTKLMDNNRPTGHITHLTNCIFQCKTFNSNYGSTMSTQSMVWINLYLLFTIMLKIVHFTLNSKWRREIENFPRILLWSHPGFEQIYEEKFIHIFNWLFWFIGFWGDDFFQTCQSLYFLIISLCKTRSIPLHLSKLEPLLCKEMV